MGALETTETAPDGVERRAPRSLDQLEAELVSRSARLNAEEYAFLRDLREFDLRKGWPAYRFNGCAEWLNFRCGLVPGVAREKLRVAHALCALPRISRAFARGGSPTPRRAR